MSPNGQDSARGAAVFYSYMLIPDVEYACQVRYRLISKARLCLTILHNGNPLQESVELPNEHGDWQEVQVSLSSFLKTDKIPDDIKTDLSQSNGSQAQTEKEELIEENDPTSSNKLSITRWKGEGSLTIENVVLLNNKGEESAVFQVGYPLKIRITVLANRKDNYDIFPALPIYRSDGVCVTKFHPRSSFKIGLLTGERCFLYLNINSINLGDGSYILSIGLFQSEVNENHRIDLVDRSYEFQVVGNPSVKNGMVFQHPAEWEILRDDKFV
jgi:hypothetical protein